MAEKSKNKHNRTLDLVLCPLYGIIGIGSAVLLIIILAEGKTLPALGLGFMLAIGGVYYFVTSLIRLIKNRYKEEQTPIKSDSKSSGT